MKINKIITEFNTPQIYCDMDGVLADFHKYTMSLVGDNFNNKDWPDMPGDIFLRLPPMSDAHTLWNFIKPYNPIILTAKPRDEFRIPTAEADKTKWMLQQFGHPSDKIEVVYRNEKQHFAINKQDNRPNLLIDDHRKNIAEYSSAGGIGVLHTSANSTIRQLKQIGYN